MEVLVNSPAGGTVLGVFLGTMTVGIFGGVRLPWGPVLSSASTFLLFVALGAGLHLIYLFFRPEKW